MSQSENTNRLVSASISGMGRRMWGAAMLRAETYEEVEADRSANLQAFGVVLLSSVSAGVDYAAGGPEHAYLKDVGRTDYTFATDEEALEAFQ